MSLCARASSVWPLHFLNCETSSFVAYRLRALCRPRARVSAPLCTGEQLHASKELQTKTEPLCSAMTQKASAAPEMAAAKTGGGTTESPERSRPNGFGSCAGFRFSSGKSTRYQRDQLDAGSTFVKWHRAEGNRRFKGNQKWKCDCWLAPQWCRPEQTEPGQASTRPRAELTSLAHLTLWMSHSNTESNQAQLLTTAVNRVINAMHQWLGSMSAHVQVLTQRLTHRWLLRLS